MGIKSKLAFNAVSAMQTARSYHVAAHVLEEHAARSVALAIVPGTNLTAERVQEMAGEKAVPVVLHALAVEIVLKVRLNRAKRPYIGHNHAKLFAKVPEEEKQMLAERYATRRNPMFRSVTLEEALKWSGDAFEEWRYRYEWPHLDASVGEMVLVYKILQEGL
jgi:hypothetical protein